MSHTSPVAPYKPEGAFFYCFVLPMGFLNHHVRYLFAELYGEVESGHGELKKAVVLSIRDLREAGMGTKDAGEEAIQEAISYGQTAKVQLLEGGKRGVATTQTAVFLFYKVLLADVAGETISFTRAGCQETGRALGKGLLVTAESLDAVGEKVALVGGELLAYGGSGFCEGGKTLRSLFMTAFYVAEVATDLLGPCVQELLFDYAVSAIGQGGQGAVKSMRAMAHAVEELIQGFFEPLIQEGATYGYSAAAATKQALVAGLPVVLYASTLTADGIRTIGHEAESLFPAALHQVFRVMMATGGVIEKTGSCLGPFQSSAEELGSYMRSAAYQTVQQAKELTRLAEHGAYGVGQLVSAGGAEVKDYLRAGIYQAMQSIDMGAPVTRETLIAVGEALSMLFFELLGYVSSGFQQGGRGVGHGVITCGRATEPLFEALAAFFTECLEYLLSGCQVGGRGLSSGAYVSYEASRPVLQAMGTIFEELIELLVSGMTQSGRAVGVSGHLAVEGSYEGRYGLMQMMREFSEQFMSGIMQGVQVGGKIAQVTKEVWLPMQRLIEHVFIEAWYYLRSGGYALVQVSGRTLFSVLPSLYEVSIQASLDRGARYRAAYLAYEINGH